MVVRRVLRRVELVDTGDELAAPFRLVVRKVEIGGVVVDVGRVQHLGEVRKALLPVAAVRRVGDEVRVTWVDHERPSPDRRSVLELHGVLGRIARLPNVFRNNRRLPGDVVEVGLRRSIEGEHDLIARRRDRLQPCGPHGVDVEGGILLQQVEGEQYVGSAHWLAVAPLDAVANREGEGLAVGRPLVVGGEHRRRLLVLQRVDEYE